MFEKILLPTDGSRHSAEAARIAAQVAERHQGEIQPLVAVEYQFISGEELPEAVSDEIRRRIDARARKALAEAAEAAAGAGARVREGKIVEGPAAEAILREAEEGEYDLIVIGSRGVSLDTGHHRLIGSVTERVLHGTPCPVLVIRAEPEP